MSIESTITVAGHFGDKEMTKEEFVKTWVDHANELMRLDYSRDWQDEVIKIKQTVCQKAISEFDRMYSEQNKEVA